MSSKWLILAALTLSFLPGCGGTTGQVNALIEEELQETRKLTKIFKEVKDENSFTYAVSAMEQPCVGIAHLRKERDQLTGKMTPAQLTTLAASPEMTSLNNAITQMTNALFDARRLIPSRQQEIDAVWSKAGLGTIGAR